MTDVVISATGLYTPPHSISNEELVTSFNQYVDRFNLNNSDSISTGAVQALERSSTEFIEKASGIKSRFVIDKEGILDPSRMIPSIPSRNNSEPSLMCEMATNAAKEALENANKDASQIDAVLVAASNMQRPYPAMAVEVQESLGINGFAFDMNVACSSATFGIQQAKDMIVSGSAKTVLIVNPEICSGHLNFRDRDSHFIFGDVCTAILLERSESAFSKTQFRIVDSKLKTVFSNNIRNNFGFLNRADLNDIEKRDKLFVQEGRKVFKEVCPAVVKLVSEQLGRLDIEPRQLKRLWLHQANLNMNLLIARKLLGEDPSSERAPVILDNYANTSSAGSIIALHKYHDDLEAGDFGVLCSFGAGYSIGSIVLERTK